MTDPTTFDTRSAANYASEGTEGLLNSFSDDQRSAVRAVLSWYADKPQREFYLAGLAGTGKTTVASWLVRHLGEAGLNVLVGAYTGKASAVLRKKGVWQAQTLHSMIYRPIEGTNPVRFAPSIDSPLVDADMLVVDECFVSSTLVDTPFGSKVISNHRTGDLVLNANGIDRVVGTFKKEVNRVAQVTVDTGRAAFTCSEDHRFFTARGLVRARDLRLGDRLAPTREAMRLLRRGFHTERCDEALLLWELRSALVASISGVPSEDLHRRANAKSDRKVESLAAQPRGGSSPELAKERCFKTFYETRSYREDPSNHAQARPVSKDLERWQRAAFTESAGRTSKSSRKELEDRTGREDRTTSETWMADLLQDRCCEPRDHGRDRGRRPVSHVARTERERREEGDVSSWSRVDGIEVLESRDPRLDRERDTDGKLYLYDLAIERHHSYSVSGILTHNCSMVGSKLAADVRDYRRKIFVLGDPGQLPPIEGAGAFTNRKPDYVLREIHRQAADSPILRLAYAARRGRPIEPSDDPRATVAPLSFASLLEAEGQVICGTHRARWAITRRIRASHGFGGLLPMIGERVLCCKNDHGLGLYNGMMGTLLEVLDDGANDVEDRPYLRIKMDDLETPIETLVHREPWVEHEAGRKQNPPLHQRGVQLFDFGWVLTCHKAQGSEWESVVVVDDSSAFGEDAPRWLYTALTRASEKVTLLKRNFER